MATMNVVMCSVAAILVVLLCGTSSAAPMAQAGFIPLPRPQPRFSERLQAAVEEVLLHSARVAVHEYEARKQAVADAEHRVHELAELYEQAVHEERQWHDEFDAIVILFKRGQCRLTEVVVIKTSWIDASSRLQQALENLRHAKEALKQAQAELQALLTSFYKPGFDAAAWIKHSGIHAVIIVDSVELFNGVHLVITVRARGQKHPTTIKLFLASSVNSLSAISDSLVERIAVLVVNVVFPGFRQLYEYSPIYRLLGSAGGAADGGDREDERAAADVIVADADLEAMLAEQTGGDAEAKQAEAETTPAADENDLGGDLPEGWTLPTDEPAL